MEDSQFIIALTVAQFVLSFLHSVKFALEKVDCNLVDAHNDVTIAKECICDTRNERSWESIWTKATQIANEIDITIQKPRSVTRQMHHSNAGGVSQSSSDYYKINVSFTFIDHVISELDVRFSSDHNGLVAAHHLSGLDQDRTDALLSYYGKYLCDQEKNDLSIYQNHQVKEEF